LADEINAEARRNPQSPYAGKFVGIVAGQVVVVAEDWDAAGRCLREMKADPTKTFCIEASHDYSQVEEI
jgi:hypothetical protein